MICEYYLKIADGFLIMCVGLLFYLSATGIAKILEALKNK